MKARCEYHIGFAFAVTIGEPPADEQLGEITRALCSDKRRLDAYVLYRCAWELMGEAGAEGDTLCGALDLPRDSREVCTLLLGLRLSPAARQFLKDIREGDFTYEIIEQIDRVVAVESDGVWGHSAMDDAA
jgi:hypothetical protein